MKRYPFSFYLLPLVLSACAVGPDYHRAEAIVPVQFKEVQGWTPAVPADALDRGNWWTLFADPELNALEEQIGISNQNIAAAVAAWQQAQALSRVQSAGLWPVLTLNGNGARNHTSQGDANSFQLNANANWEADVWGKLARAAQGTKASEQASAADLANARLSAQAALASNYFALRQADAQRELLRDTVDSYRRALAITENRYAAGVATRTDVLQAQTQLDNALASELTSRQTRTQLEHAIAVLIGKAPADFSLAAAPWIERAPAIPVGLPSTLLQRRPDIASAERKVAAANEQIGIAKSAWFPAIRLSGSNGFSSGTLSDLVQSSHNLWSLGFSAAQTFFDAGATSARVDAATAAHQQAVAAYRQLVLSAFQNVEDQLTAAKALDEQLRLRRKAVEEAAQVERNALNRYRQGLVAYTDVVVAQTSALNAKSALLQTIGSRQSAAIGLIQALGGGWNADQNL